MTKVSESSRECSIEEALRLFKQLVNFGTPMETISEEDTYTIYKFTALKQTAEFHFYHDENRALIFTETYAD